MVLDTIIGSDVFEMLKNSTDPIIQRKLLVSKWVYSTGMLLNHCFPSTNTFAPAEEVTTDTPELFCDSSSDS